MGERKKQGGREREIGVGERERVGSEREKINREICWEKEAEPQRVRKK